MFHLNHVPTLFQMKRRGIFGGSLVIQTLTAHYTATSGAVDVPSIGNPDHPSVALALSACVVSHSYSLI
jgi:hypothetical protein